MIAKDQTYIVMGLLDPDSIAFAIGQSIEHWGGKVTYTVQSDRIKRIFLDRSKKLSDDEKEALDIRFCDVTIAEEVEALFDGVGTISGVVHSIAYANPKTCLGESFFCGRDTDLCLDR